MDSTTRILPAHIEETVRAIAKLQADHAEQAEPIQRVVDKITAFVGRPQFLLIITIGVLSWIGINSASGALAPPLSIHRPTIGCKPS